MKKLKAAWAGYDHNITDLWEMYRQYAEMGFQAIDGDLSRMSGDPVENLRRFRDLGLKNLCAEVEPYSFRQIADDPQAKRVIVERARFYDTDCVNIGWTSVISSFGSHYGNNGTYDQMMRDIENLNDAVRTLADEGLHPMYHNHYQEFTVHYKGVSVMDYYLTQVDPRLKLKLDVGWVYAAGLDPVEYLEKAKERVQFVHVKDFTSKEKAVLLVNSDRETDFGFTAVGTGKLDLAGILGKMVEIGQDWAIVEQDRLRHLNVYESLQAAYYNIKETGFVE